MRIAVVVAVVVGLGTAAGGCGGDGPAGPEPLVPDPAVVTGCAPGPVAAGTTRAKPVACADELIGGRLAGGRIGDFLLENARVRVIVRGPGEGLYLHGAWGGGIVDAAPAGGEDLIKEMLPSVDLAVGAFDELVITEAGDDGPAELVVRGPATALDIIAAALAREPPPVVIEHHYRLAADADVVELETRIFPRPLEPPLDQTPTVYDALFTGGRVHAFVPGAGWATGLVGGDVIASDGTTSSYGITYPAGAGDPRIVELAGVRLIEGPPPGDEPLRRWLVIGDGSVASVTERAWQARGQALGTIAGTVAGAVGLDVVVLDGAGQPVTIARTDADSHFRAAVPPGAYTVHTEGTGRVTGTTVAVDVVAGEVANVAPPAGAGGTLTVSVRDGSGQPIPARVLIEQTGADRRIEWVGASGDGAWPVEPGAWSVSVSRGLEYDAFSADPVAITDGQSTALAVVLDRVVDTAGWISLDTHLHSEMSTDSTFPLDDRLRAVAGEGVEVPVSSDHDFVTDYAPVIAELGLGAWLGSLTGEEASSVVWGHLNAWPLIPDPARAGAGAPRWRGRAPAEVFAALRDGIPTRIVQVNHPRFGTTSLFDAIDLDPARLVARRDPAELGLPPTADLSDLGFDAIEVANGLADDDFDEVFADWLAMVAAGHPAVATGSSDSHGPGAWAGEARTYVWVGPGGDDPAAIDPAAIGNALRARHVVVGTGAFVTAGVVGPSGTSLPGDTVDVTGMAQVTIHVTVQAAPWQPLARIRIYGGSAQGVGVVREVTLDPGDTAPVRHDADLTVPAPTADTFYVVRVDGGGRGDPVLGDPLPAFTNPLFVTVTP